MKRTFGLLSAAVAVGLGAHASREAILLEHPTYWYAFDNNAVDRSSGLANLTITNNGGTNVALVEHNNGVGGYLNCTGGGCPYGASFALGNGSWTYMLRVQAVAEANRAIMCLGAATTGNHGLVLYTKNANTLTLAIVEGLATFEHRLDIPVDNVTAWHDYAFCFDLADRAVSVWVDGVKMDATLPHPSYSKSNQNWQWFSLYGGLGSSGLLVGTGCSIDDFRFYQRILTPAEIAALREGRTQVPVYGGFVPTDGKTIWKNQQLRDIVRFRTRMGGSSVSNQRFWTVPFYETRSATGATMQMQLVEDGTYNKVVKVEFSQNGNDIVASGLYAKYCQPAAGGINATQGNDFDINPQNGSTVALGNDVSAYGLHQITADTLYDDNAAIWTAGDGALSASANWLDGSAVTAKRPLSFVTGTGTVQNDFPAGTAFGTFAMGVESGARTISGNAASFAEVLNVSTSALTFTAPLVYEGDFKPYSLGPITFTDLSVGGTFQPVGSGDIQFAGETHIAKADIRYHVKTDDEQGYGKPGWATSKGYGDNGKLPFYLLRTLPGGVTYIDDLLQSQCGQRCQVTMLEGDFVLGGNPLPGNDGRLVLKNGTTRFVNFYQPTSSIGVNAYVYVHEDGTLDLPGINSTTAVYMFIDGTVKAGDASAATSLNLYPITQNGTGSFNARLLGGSAITARGVTIGPEGAILAIPTAITLAQNEGDPGVTFRTSTPDGNPAAVSMSGLLNAGTVPLAITGGGTFSYKNATALSLAQLSVGADTTADLSAPASVTLANTELAAGAKLVLPLTAEFAAKPTLPTDGTATLAFAAVPNLAGTYTLGGTDWTDADLAHLAVALEGDRAGQYTAALSVANGALKLTVTEVPAVAGAKSAHLFARGYMGSTALSQFPALIKLPAHVKNFRYSESTADGSDLWFSDANGNRIPHEIESWTPGGDSFVWVRVPSLTPGVEIVVHWGDAASKPALSDTKTFSDDYLGVWHFADTTWKESSPNALATTAYGTPTIRESKVGNGFYNASGANHLEAANNSKWLAYANTKQLSVSGWFKINTATSNMRIISCKSTWSSAGGFEITSRDTAGTSLLAGCNNNAQYTGTGTPNQVNEWVHFTVIYDGTLETPESRMYINGVYKTKATGANYCPVTKSDPLALGGTPTPTPTVNPLLGGLDEVRLTKTVLSEEWIKADYDTANNPTGFFTEEDDYTIVTGSTYENVAPAYGTTEYAGSHVLAYAYPVTPIVISGDVTSTAEYGLFQYYDAKVTVKEGGTLTLARMTRFGEYNVPMPQHVLGAHLVVEGGLVQSPSGSLDYSGFNPANPGAETPARPMHIEMTGGKFTVKLNAWQSAANMTNMVNSTVNVGGTAEFAPGAFGWRNSVSGNIGTFRWYVTMDGNGRFTLPASGVPSVVHVDVAGGTPSLGSEDESYFSGTLELATGKTLAIAAGTVINTGVISGEGAFTVEDGAVFDLSESASNDTEFTGSITVKAGGVLILSSDKTPTYTITLEAGARVIATVEDVPSGTAPFLGALAAVPGEGTATIEFDLPQSVPQGSAYTLSTSQLPAGSAVHLAIAFTGAAGETTQGVVELGDDGEVIARITDSAAKGALEWKGGDFTGTSWWQHGSADETLYAFMPNLPLWFTDRGVETTVTASEDVKSGVVTFNSTKDYDLRGAKILADKVVKDGTGTLTLNGSGFTTEDFTVKSGTLVLGDAAARNVLGGNTATLTIEAGATLDLNTQVPTSGDTNRGAVLNDHIVTITGEGVDGKGAITDHSIYTALWQFQLGRVQVKGDATIGGTCRIDLRKASNSTFEGRAWLKGGSNDTLRVKNHVEETTNCGLNFNNTDVEIGKIVLEEGGMMGYEVDTVLNVPGGVEMKAGSRIHYWNAAKTKAAIVVTGEGAGLKASSADANTQDKPVTIRNGASLDLRGEKALSFKDWFLNEGALTVSGGTHKFLDAAVTNNGSIAVSGGEIDLGPAAFVGSLEPTVTGGTLKIGGKTDWTPVDMAFTMTGGVLRWGFGDADGFPLVDADKVDTSGITAGDIYFHTGKSDTIPTAFTEAAPAKVFIHNTTADSITTLPSGNWTVKTLLSIADGGNYGYLRLADGANLTAQALDIATTSASSKNATLELLPGSTLTVPGAFCNGRYSGASDYIHTVLINGGTLNNTGTTNYQSAYDTPRAYTILNSGVFNVTGIDVRNRASYIYANSDERFTMNGGTLNLGANGFWTVRTRYDQTDVDLVGGHYVAAANHAVRKYGLLMATGNALDGEKGEGLTLDLNGHTVDHSYTPHFGASDVTIVGNGTYTTNPDWQGIVHGKWTVATEPAATVNLTGFAGFAGGLELQEGTSADLGISGEGAVEFAYLPMSFDVAYTNVVLNNGPMPSVASHFQKMHRYYASGAPVNTCSFAVRGQFYVPEEDAGTWTFAGNYDDYIGLWVDGSRVFYHATWNSINRNTATIGAGWHDFALIVYDGSGGQGTYMWQNDKCLGWRKGEVTSTAAADYKIFDTSTLRMRVKPQSPTIDGVTAYRTTPGSSFASEAALAGNNNWTLYGENVSMQGLLNTKVAGFQQTCACRLTGGFLVDEAHEGEWTFYCSWDDRIQVNIDGKRTVDNGDSWQNLGQNKVTLKAGWHSFEIRAQDGSGGYGPDAKAINGGLAVAVQRPGDTAKQPFDERTLTFTTKSLLAQRAEKPGLGGESTIAANAELRNGLPWTGNNLLGRYCPIYGSIGGAGALTGAFRFTGDDNCWRVKADHRSVTEKLVFENADENTLAGLKKIHVEFSERPTTEYFELSNPLGLTAETVAGIKVEAPIPDALRTDFDGDSTDFEFTAVLRNGKLCLKNGHPKNGTVLFLR